MSEHFGVTGKVRFYHLPYDELGSMCYCHFCRKTIRHMTINLHEGFMQGWIEVKCNRCKRTVWTAGFAVDSKTGDQICLTKLDKKCCICKKKCGEHNCFCSISSTRFKGLKWICSRRCENKFIRDGKK